MEDNAPLADSPVKLISSAKPVANHSPLGGRNYQSVYCSYNFSFVTFIHFPGWQKLP